MKKLLATLLGLSLVMTSSLFAFAESTPTPPVTDQTTVEVKTTDATTSATVKATDTKENKNVKAKSDAAKELEKRKADATKQQQQQQRQPQQPQQAQPPVAPQQKGSQDQAKALTDLVTKLLKENADLKKRLSQLEERVSKLSPQGKQQPQQQPQQQTQPVNQNSALEKTVQQFITTLDVKTATADDVKSNKQFELLTKLLKADLNSEFVGEGIDETNFEKLSMSTTSAQLAKLALTARSVDNVEVEALIWKLFQGAQVTATELAPRSK